MRKHARIAGIGNQNRTFRQHPRTIPIRVCGEENSPFCCWDWHARGRGLVPVAAKVFIIPECKCIRWWGRYRSFLTLWRPTGLGRQRSPIIVLLSRDQFSPGPRDPQFAPLVRDTSLWGWLLQFSSLFALLLGVYSLLLVRECYFVKECFCRRIWDCLLCGK